MSKYWNDRKHMLYYKALFQMISVVGYDARSLIDVGSSSAEYITWFGWIERRVQLNKGSFKGTLPGIERINADFFEWTPDDTYDVTLCSQVLEHVRDPRRFCDRLKSISRRLVISVPYNWRAGGTPGHVQDPVDEVKVRSWMGLKPNHQAIIREPFGPARYIAYYDLEQGERYRIPREFSRQAVREMSERYG
jgi:hypothetical protein